MNLQWLGGLWDGEGSVATGLRREGRSVAHQLTLNMTHKPTIDEAERIFKEGGVQKVSRTDRPILGQKHAYMLFICNRQDLLIACGMLIPFTFTKRAEIEALQLMVMDLIYLNDEPYTTHEDIYNAYRPTIDRNRV